MYRITAEFKSGGDLASLTAVIVAGSVVEAFELMVMLLKQIGFKAEDYSLTHLFDLNR